MSGFEDQVEYRPEKFYGHGGWWWPKLETGAWHSPPREFEGLRDLILPRCAQRRLVIQAGGCCGMYPVFWSSHFGKVITFEPAALNFYCMGRNIKTDNIYPFRAALGSERGMITLEQAEACNVGMHIVGRGGNEWVPQVRIDDLALPFCDAIQLDVEQWEAHVLKGAVETIKTHKPVVSVETNDADVRNLMAELGYQMIGVATDAVYAPRP